MPSFLEIGLANAVCALVLALLALAIGRVVRRPAVMHGLWLLVLLKLVTPPVFPLALPVLPAAPATPTISPPLLPTDETPTLTKGKFLLLPPQTPGEVVVAVQFEPAAMPPQDALTPPPDVVPISEPPLWQRIDWADVQRSGVAVWVAGAVLWFAVAAWRMARFGRLLRHAAPGSSDLQRRAAALASEMGLTRCPEVALVPGLVPPMVWMTFRRPRVYLPAALMDSLDETQRDTLLAHELAHLRRRDHWVRWIEFLVQGLYWWFPLVPFARRQVQDFEEECCDALVTDVLPARSYALAIVQTLDFLAGDATPLPVTASGLRGVASLKTRLTRILDGGVAGRLGLLGRVGLLAVASALLPLWPSLAQTVPPPAATGPAEEAPELVGPPAEEPFVEPAVAAEESSPRVLACSSDGLRMALALENETIEIRDGTGERRIMTLRGHEAAVNVLAFSPDGRTLASGSSDRTVRLWHTRTGHTRLTLAGHESWVYALAFSPDGSLLATGGYDRVIRLWDVASGKARAVLPGHAAAVRCLAFSPDGATLASGSGDRTVRLWDVSSRTERAVFRGHQDTVRGLAFAPDGGTLASVGDDSRLVLWAPASGQSRLFSWGPGEMTCLAFAPGGRCLVTGGPGRGLGFWDVVDGRLLLDRSTPGGGILGLAVPANDTTLVTLGQDRQVRTYHLARVSVRLAQTAEGGPARTVEVTGTGPVREARVQTITVLDLSRGPPSSLPRWSPPGMWQGATDVPPVPQLMRRAPAASHE